MAEQPDYKGAGPYPVLIAAELWDRVNAAARADQACPAVGPAMT